MCLRLGSQGNVFLPGWRYPGNHFLWGIMVEFFVCAVYMLPEGGIRVDRISTHSKNMCDGQRCVIHNPSDHHMRGMRLHWQDDIALMERICEHGVAHPDPDHLAYVKGNVPHIWVSHSIHENCDFCCIDKRV